MLKSSIYFSKKQKIQNKLSLEAKMESFATFNFDILAIIVLIAGLLFGSYYGFGRQLKKTINLILPFVILHFSLSYIVAFLLRITFISSSKEKTFLWLSKHFIVGKYENVAFSLLIGVIIYILLYLIINLIIKLFSLSKEKVVLAKTKAISRILGAVLSLVNTYIFLMLLLFTLGTAMLSDVSNPLASGLAKTSTNIFDISLLHIYQNDNVQKNEDWSEALRQITGESAGDYYQELSAFATELGELNEYIKLEMLPNISLASRSRIETATINDNYVLSLMVMGEKKVLFHYILIDEKANPLYEELHEKYEYLLANRGYVYFLSSVLENDFSTYTYNEIFLALQTNKEEILNHFIKGTATVQFTEVYNSMAFFYYNQEELYSLAGFPSETYTIDDYIRLFKQLFSSAAATDDFVDHFSSLYTKEYLADKNVYEKGIFQTVEKAFNIHEKYKEKVFLIDSRLPYASRLVLGQLYKGFFLNHTWEDEILLRDYFSDTLSSKELPGYDLYFSYFTFEYVLLTEGSLITIDDVRAGLTRIKDLANMGIITDTARYNVLEDIFTKDTGFLFELLERNLLSENLINDILNSPTIDSEIKVYLTD